MARRPKGPVSDTRGRILDVAEGLAQHRGFNGFSYADIAGEMGITTASLHYHFAGKAELGRSLIERYAERFAQKLEEIDATSPDARARLEAYAGLYAALLEQGRFCLCGVLAAEYETLPKPMRDAVTGFFDKNEVWLIQVLELGKAQGALQFSGAAADAARMIVAGLEGAMLVARPYGEVARFKAAAVQLLAGLARTVPAQPQAG